MYFDLKSISQTESYDNQSVVDKKKSRAKRQLLQELYFNGHKTIAQLSKELHSSIPSVTAFVEELKIENWITEVGTAEVQFGRKPTLYALNPNERYIITLDVSTFGSKAAVVNLNNEIIYQQDLHFNLEDKAIILQKLIDSIDSIMANAGFLSSAIVGIGIAMPGLINPKTGFNFTYRQINPFGTTVTEWLKNHFNIPVFLLNDTQATIVGEKKFGDLDTLQNVLSINMDWGGIGLGVILDGKVFQGSSGFAGELGHIPVKEDGELCGCGKVGCLDTLTSATALIRRIKHQLKNGKVSNLSKYNIDEIDIEMVIEVANSGDALSIDLLHDIGKEVGKGLSIAVHLFNPEAIIINGVLAKAGRLISNPIEQAIDKYCLADFRSNLIVKISNLGITARLLGTHVYVIENLLGA